VDIAFYTVELLEWYCHQLVMPVTACFWWSCAIADVVVLRCNYYGCMKDGVDGEPLARRPQSSAAYVHLRSSSTGLLLCMCVMNM